MDKTVDIVIPAYHALTTLDRALSSISMQTAKDKINVIIVDDNSGDDYDFLLEYWNKQFSCELLRLEENGGPGMTRRKGFEYGQAPYVMFMDADDSFSNAFVVEFLLNEIKNDGVHHVISSFLEEVRIRDKNSGQMVTKFVPHDLNYTWVFGKIYERKFLEDEGIMFNDTRANEDTGFNTKIALSVKDTKKNISFLNMATYSWHYKEDSITRLNNHVYTYTTGFEGYLYNISEALFFAQEHHPENDYRIKSLALEVMTEIFASFRSCSVEKEKNMLGMCNMFKKFYKETFCEVWKDLNYEISNFKDDLLSRKNRLYCQDENSALFLFDKFMEALKENRSNKYFVESFKVQRQPQPQAQPKR